VRILHTSDWHLGRSFHRVGLLDAQAAYIDHLVDVVRDEKVDLLLVAGDVYDRALPAVDVVWLLDETLARLSSAGVQVIISSGNHDSARRLGFGSQLMDRAGVFVRTKVSALADPILVSDGHGQIAFYPIPYLEPSLVAEQLAAEPTHEGVLGAAIERIRVDRGRRDPALRSVVLAHAFVAGGHTSESERDIRVGGVSIVPTSLFEGVTYAALGHLHGRQELTPTIRYSGSPIAYSFSEQTHTKSSWLVEIGAHEVKSVTEVAAPVPRALAVLRGPLEELLSDHRHESAEIAWCQITLTDPIRPRSAMERLRRRFPHALELRFDPQGAQAERLRYADQLSGRSDLDICCGFLDHVRGHRNDPAETVVLRQALEATRLLEVES
jgi:exonuclease SbcD